MSPVARPNIPHTVVREMPFSRTTLGGEVIQSIFPGVGAVMVYDLIRYPQEWGDTGTPLGTNYQGPVPTGDPVVGWFLDLYILTASPGIEGRISISTLGLTAGPVVPTMVRALTLVVAPSVPSMLAGWRVPAAFLQVSVFNTTGAAITVEFYSSVRSR